MHKERLFLSTLRARLKNNFHYNCAAPPVDATKRPLRKWK